jgi:hypothetical protein
MRTASSRERKVGGGKREMKDSAVMVSVKTKVRLE